MFQSHGHNHGRCIKSAMKVAIDLCVVRGVRLTALRSRVLELIWQRHQPVGAYELLDLLKIEKSNAQPPTIYRTLNFLIGLGLVHRIESLNAYVGCASPNINHNAQFLICSECGAAAEISDVRLDKAINAIAKDANFSINHRSIEVGGQCPNCQVS
jgi:Fur family zinc uptake transcriptional regulator